MIFKSVHFPNEIVATRRGSPLLIGVKTPKKLKVDFVDVEFGGIAEERERKCSSSPSGDIYESLGSVEPTLKLNIFCCHIR